MRTKSDEIETRRRTVTTTVLDALARVPNAVFCAYADLWTCARFRRAFICEHGKFNAIEGSLNRAIINNYDRMARQARATIKHYRVAIEWSSASNSDIYYHAVGMLAK